VLQVLVELALQLALPNPMELALLNLRQVQLLQANLWARRWSHTLACRF
jgi:hypothetical protein